MADELRHKLTIFDGMILVAAAAVGAWGAAAYGAFPLTILPSGSFTQILYQAEDPEKRTKTLICATALMQLLGQFAYAELDARAVVLGDRRDGREGRRISVIRCVPSDRLIRAVQPLTYGLALGLHLIRTLGLRP